MKFICAAIFLFILVQIAPMSSYFSQDDFYHLRQVSNKKLTDLPTIITPGFSQEQTFYRPLGREIYNFVALNIFGLNPLPYHLVNLVLIMVNGFIIMQIIPFFSKNKLLPRFVFLIYILSAVHPIELYYLSSIQTLMATFFVLLGVLSYLKSLKLLSFLCFVLALLSHESSAVFILIVAVLEIFSFKKTNMKSIIKNIAIFSIPVALILLVHFTTVGLPETQVYKPVFSPISILNSLIWFTLWSFGLPEMLTDFITLRFSINPNLFKFYGDYVRLVFSLLTICMGLLLYMVVYYRKVLVRQKLLLFLAFFVISLTPFLFFPQHKFVYYLTLPIVFFSLSLGAILSTAWESKLRILVVIIIACYGIISYKTLEINKITYWAAKRAGAAQVLMIDIVNKYPSVNKGAVFYFKKDKDYPEMSKEWGSSSKQAFYILSGSDALQLYYKDPTIKVYYEDIDLKPQNKELIIYTPKFPY